MHSIVLLAALSSSAEAPGFHPKEYPYGWPCGARGWCCNKDCSFIPYWYSGTYTFYPNYFSPFAQSYYAQPWVPGPYSPPNGYPIPAGPEGMSGTGEMGQVLPSGNEKIGPKGPERPLPSRLKNDGMSSRQAEQNGQFRAELALSIPENATLFVNGVRMKPGSGTRTFYTPQLSAAQKHYYDLRLETMKDGKTVVSEKTIEVKPGKMELAGIFSQVKDLALASEKDR